MIITGGEPELCCSMARHSMLRKRVGSTHACMHSVCVSLIQNAVCMCCACVEKYENGDWRENLTYVKAKDGDTGYRQRSARMKVRWSLSFQPRSSLCGCLCFSLFNRWHSRSCSYHSHCWHSRSCSYHSHCWHSWSCSYHHYVLHCSHERGMAWHGSVGTCNISVSREWDRHGQSVSRSMHVVPYNMLVWGLLTLTPITSTEWIVHVPLTTACCVYSNVHVLVNTCRIRYHTAIDPIHSSSPPVHAYHTRTSVSVEVPNYKLPLYITCSNNRVGNSSTIRVVPVAQDNCTWRLGASTTCCIVSDTEQGIIMFTNILQGHNTVVLVCCTIECEPDIICT